MVPDHIQIFLQMIYSEVKVDFNERKGTSLLGIMEIKRKVVRGVSGFEYSLVDYSIKGYSGQYHAQV